jgi:hypothetical protein
MMRKLAILFVTTVICASAATAYAGPVDRYYGYGNRPAHRYSSLPARLGSYWSLPPEDRAVRVPGATPRALYADEATYGMFNRRLQDIAN